MRGSPWVPRYRAVGAAARIPGVGVRAVSLTVAVGVGRFLDRDGVPARLDTPEDLPARGRAGERR